MILISFWSYGYVPVVLEWLQSLKHLKHFYLYNFWNNFGNSIFKAPWLKQKQGEWEQGWLQTQVLILLLLRLNFLVWDTCLNCINVFIHTILGKVQTVTSTLWYIILRIPSKPMMSNTWPPSIFPASSVVSGGRVAEDIHVRLWCNNNKNCSCYQANHFLLPGQISQLQMNRYA